MKIWQSIALVLIAGVLFKLGALWVATRRPEKQFNYFASQLDAWVNDGGDITDVPERVVKNCGKLVISQAGMTGAVRLVTVDRRALDYRTDICTRMTINRLYKQPMFQNQALLKAICRGKDPLFPRLCARSNLTVE